MPRKIGVSPAVEEDPKARARRLAQEAVQNFENLREELNKEERIFQEEHPEAWKSLQDIHKLKDDVSQAVAAAKPLVAALGESIGEFRVTIKSTKPHYDETKFASILCELESSNLGDVFKALHAAGVITAVSLDKEAVSVYFPRNPEVQEGFTDAFDPGGTPLTPAVSVPKV
jgi:hypothetical protein